MLLRSHFIALCMLPSFLLASSRDEHKYETTTLEDLEAFARKIPRRDVDAKSKISYFARLALDAAFHPEAIVQMEKLVEHGDKPGFDFQYLKIPEGQIAKQFTFRTAKASFSVTVMDEKLHHVHVGTEYDVSAIKKGALVRSASDGPFQVFPFFELDHEFLHTAVFDYAIFSKLKNLVGKSPKILDGDLVDNKFIYRVIEKKGLGVARDIGSASFPRRGS